MVENKIQPVNSQTFLAPEINKIQSISLNDLGRVVRFSLFNQPQGASLICDQDEPSSIIFSNGVGIQLENISAKDFQSTCSSWYKRIEEFSDSVSKNYIRTIKKDTWVPDAHYPNQWATNNDHAQLKIRTLDESLLFDCSYLFYGAANCTLIVPKDLPWFHEFLNLLQ